MIESLKYGLNDRTIFKINEVFSSFSQIDKVILYGSRAMGNYKTGSDFDLTVKGHGINLQIMNQIGLLLDDLLLPYTIDLSDFSHIKNEELIEHIERVGIDFYVRNRV